MRGLWPVAAMLMSATPAFGQAQTAEFSIGAVHFTMPVPAGYCLPKSEAELATERYAASLDTINRTHLTLFSCGPKADPMDYVILKTPLSLVSVPMKRADILNDPAFATPDRDVSMPGVEKHLEGSLSEVTGSDVEISLAIGVRGHDDVCGYFGGVAQAQVGSVKYMSAGACMTVIGDRLVAINAYAPGNDPATPKRLMAFARQTALTIRVKP